MLTAGRLERNAEQQSCQRQVSVSRLFVVGVFVPIGN